MKFFVVVFALCIAGALGERTKEEMEKKMEYKNDCMKETGVDPTVVENARQGNVDEKNEKLGCLAACMMKKLAVMNADGTFNEEVTRAKIPNTIPKNEVDDAVAKCNMMKGDDHCAMAAKMMMDCYGKEKSWNLLLS